MPGRDFVLISNFGSDLNSTLGKYPPNSQHIELAVSKFSLFFDTALKQFPVSGLH